MRLATITKKTLVLPFFVLLGLKLLFVHAAILNFMNKPYSREYERFDVNLLLINCLKKYDFILSLFCCLDGWALAIASSSLLCHYDDPRGSS